MKIRQFFQLAVVALSLGVTACTDEIASNDDNQDLVLKDGETAVAMNIAGLTGKTTARSANNLSRAAGDNITLAGEVKLDKLDIYCFVNLSGTSSATVVENIDAYTLERVYHYEALGSTNDIVLTPDGEGYKASFGITAHADRKRAFILVANDNQTRTVNPKAELNENNNRDGATAYADVLAWKVLADDLNGNPTNLTTPLIMQGKAQWSTYDGNGQLVTNMTYDAAKLAEGISATLNRRVARIDISNPVATGFTVTNVTLTGAKNATLFSDLAGAAADQTVVFAPKDVNNAEVINAALYALPMNADATPGQFPSVKIEGKLGTTDLSLTAKFAGDAMAAATKGMQPNTRYVVNIINNEGNLTAMITIADWNYGETVDTEDIISQLNAGAKLEATQDKSTLNDATKTLYITYNVSYEENTTFATITGVNSNQKPIGIVLPEDCDWIKVVKDSDQSTAKYNLQFTTKSSNNLKPRTANLSLITWNESDKKQVISEFIIHQDYLDLTTRNGEFEFISIWYEENITSTVLYLPPFGTDIAMSYEDTGIDIVIPEDCSWLRQDRYKKWGGRFPNIAVTDNVGKPERQAVVTLRRWKNNAIETQEVTVIQTGTLDKTTLSSTHDIVLNEYLVEQNRVKFDPTQNTIVVSGNVDDLTSIPTGKNIDYIFYIRGAEGSLKGGTQAIKPVYVKFEQEANWVMFDNSLTTTQTTQHEYKVCFPDFWPSSTNARETKFTVTTYVNGGPVEKTYRLIQQAQGNQTLQ